MLSVVSPKVDWLKSNLTLIGYSSRSIFFTFDVVSLLNVNPAQTKKNDS